jgi:hypothetical protein
VRGETLEDARFDDLALRLFEYQLRYNEPYARYCARLGIASAPSSWDAIPAVPAAAFKSAAVSTFDASRAALIFETSGTTAATTGRHYMETSELYDAVLLAGFDRFVLADGARLRYFNLVPDPHERPQSSLGYMMARVGGLRGLGPPGWYLQGGELLAERLATDLAASIAAGEPVCIATTAFALVAFLDEMERRGWSFELPAGSRVMETGGFKGRTRIVERGELYARTCERFGIAAGAIVAEYGMTELTSQYYDALPGRAKASPPWLRARIVDARRSTLADGRIGSVLHVDLANRSSCIAIQTEDLGMHAADGFVLLGRERTASPRGCSLDAEDLATRSAGAHAG